MQSTEQGWAKQARVMTPRPFPKCLPSSEPVANRHRSLPLRQCPLPSHLLSHRLVSSLLQVEGQLPWLTVGTTSLPSWRWCQPVGWLAGG